MGWIESIVRAPVKVAVGVILVVLFGIIAIYRMPIQLIPEVQIPTLTIETTWPGASPQEVEREIVLEQEEQLQSVEGVTKMSSESTHSLAKITVEFPVGTDLNSMLPKVLTRLNQVRELPPDADEPVISTSSASDRPIAWFILFQRMPSDQKLAEFAAEHPQLAGGIAEVRRAFNPGLAMYRLRELAEKHPEAESLVPKKRDISELRRFCEDTIEARFERVKGVSQANVMGGREDELQVIVDPQRLAARQITIADVRRALAAENKDTSGGDFWEGKRRWVVRTLGQFRSVGQVENVIIANRDGSPVYVRDVAEVKLGFKKPDGAVRRYGNAVIAINTLRETGSNVLAVMEGLQEAVKELNDGVLKQDDLELAQVYDETEYIHSSIDLVWDNIWEGAGLTFIVLLLFLRSFRSALVVFLSISVSIVGMFLMMLMMGRTLNVPSLAGIAFAVGMLVDNFIVVLENAYRHRHMGKTPFQAAVHGINDVWGAVLASTLANLAVFIPVLFVEDEAGQLFRDIALATASALALSLLVSLFVVPTMAARVLGGGIDDPLSGPGEGSDEDRPSRSQRLRGSRLGLRHFFDRILTPIDAFGRAFVTTVTAANYWLQQGVLRRVFLALGMIGTSVALSYLMLPKVEYLPTGNRNLVFGILLPPPGYNLEHLERMGATLEQRLRPYWDVDPGSPKIEKLKFPAISDFFYVARGRQLFLGLRAQDPLKAAGLVKLIQSVTGDLPGTIVVANQSSLFEQGLAAGRSIDVDITGPDIHTLVALGGQVIGQTMKLIPGAQPFPKPSLDLSAPEMHIVPKLNQASDMQITAVDLGYAVDALVDGAYASDYYLHGDKIDLSIIGKQEFASRTQDLQSLPIALPGGGLNRLDAVADVTFSSGPEQVNRRERKRAITIQVTPPPQMPLEEAMDIVQTKIIDPMRDAGQLDHLHDISMSGTADKLKLAWQAMRWNLLLALIITYLVMAALFESWLFPLVIMLSVPLGAVGGFAGLQLLNLWGLQYDFHQSLDVLTMLGFILLVGTVVNNPILIVEQALNNIRDDRMPVQQAVVESVRTRIRPIFMTALIGFFGLIPLVLSPGAGSELYRGLGAVLLGGLVVSTVFTLFLVPALFSLTMEAKQGLIRIIDKLLAREPRQQTRDSEADHYEIEVVDDIAPLDVPKESQPIKTSVSPLPLLPAQLTLDELILDDHKLTSNGNESNGHENGSSRSKKISNSDRTS
jgi:hydrophobic/amphiphilic exporter-1 (mainly G- bacteria), HAE1 family